MCANKYSILNRKIIACDQCPRLLAHCAEIASRKRAAYVNENYWGRPVPNFGEATGKLLVVGLAPGAHGANRTGRMFTGDRSGQWLFRALHRAGFATQDSFESANDGMRLVDCAITAVCHCAPPDNKPTRDEVAACNGFFERTWELAAPRVAVALGRLAWDETVRLAKQKRWWNGASPKFGHLALVEFPTFVLMGSFHPSQQNTFTRRLTEPMLDAVFSLARQRVDSLSVR